MESTKAGLSEVEASAVEELRHRVQKELENAKYGTDLDLLRFAQGFHFHMDLAERKLRRHLRIRKVMLETILDRDIRNPVIQKYFPSGLMGPTGKDNSILLISTMGRVDVDGMNKVTGLLDWMFTQVWDMEMAVKAVRETERETGLQSHCVVILDMEGLPFSSGALDCAKSFSYLMVFMDANYVEFIHKVLVVNAPTVFYYIWTVLKPLIPEKTKNKVMVLGSIWKSEVLQYVHPDCLPKHWGGNLVDKNGDPMCRENIVIPNGKIPKELYFDTSKIPELKQQLTKITVPASKAYWMTVKMEDLSPEERRYGRQLDMTLIPESTLGFGVYLTEEEEDTNREQMEMIFPEIERFGGHDNPLPNFLTASLYRPGFLRIWFDNSFSWFTSATYYFGLKLGSSVLIGPSED